jgi:ATP adenylyltransferase
MKKVVNKRFAKGKPEYEKVISQIDNLGKCPFCKDNFKYHKKPILKSSGGWFLTESSWPYKNARKHFLGISEKHKENFSELDSKDFDSIKNLINWANDKFKIKGGAFAMRFGETNYTGATVCHIHFHMITPELDAKKLSKTVNFPIG